MGADGQQLPAPVPLVDGGWRSVQPQPLARATRELGRWILRHLGDINAIRWLLRRGGVLHPDFRFLVRRKLRQDAALPDHLRRLWSMLSSEAYSARKSVVEPYNSDALLSDVCESAFARGEILWLLATVPQISISPQHELRYAVGSDDERATFEGSLRIALELSGGSTARLIVDRLSAPSIAPAILKALSNGFVGLLDDALGWFSFLSSIDPDSGGAYYPSIAPSDQNLHLDDWSRLIDLNRLAFETFDSDDADGARALVDQWSTRRGMLFRRLELHAATDGRTIDPDRGVKLLLGKEAEVLWSLDTRRECLRYLRRAGARISATERAELISAILTGPPASLFRASLTGAELDEARERMIWVRLGKLESSGTTLPKHAKAFLLEIAAKRSWRLAADESDEFLMWLGPLRGEPGEGEEWQQLAQRRPGRALRKLARGALSETWDVVGWSRVLQEFGSPDFDRAFDRRRLTVVLSRLQSAPDQLVQSLLRTVSHWLSEQSRRLPRDCEGPLLRLWQRTAPLSLAQPIKGGQCALRTALNHAAGDHARAILNLLWGRKPKAHEGIPADLKGPLDWLASASDAGSFAARVILARDVLSLFTLDEAWTSMNLLHRFSWTDMDEARAMWEAYLWNARFNPDFIKQIKPEFLQVFEHLSSFGRHPRESAVRLLVYVNIDSPQSFTRGEIVEVLRRLQPPDLAQAARALAVLLEDNEKPAILWRETIRGWLHRHWPSRTASESADVSVSLAEAFLNTGEAFPEAVDEMKERLSPIVSAHHRVVYLLQEKALHTKYPATSLEFLDALVPTHASQPGSWYGLREILDEIRTVEPALESDSRYRRLDETLLATGH